MNGLHPRLVELVADTIRKVRDDMRYTPPEYQSEKIRYRIAGLYAQISLEDTRS